MWAIVYRVEAWQNSSTRVSDCKMLALHMTHFLHFTIHMCFTPCRSIISWKIWPPVIPTKLWSISGCRKGCSGCTSRIRSSLRLNAGLGIGRCAVAAAAAAGRGAVSDTLRLGEAWVWVWVCACVVLRYGETAAGDGLEEKRRLGRHCTARLAVVACSIVAAGFMCDLPLAVSDCLVMNFVMFSQWQMKSVKSTPFWENCSSDSNSLLLRRNRDSRHRNRPLSESLR